MSSTNHTFSWESDKRKRKRHIQKRLEVSSDSGPSPHTCISKRSDEKKIECRRHERVESTRESREGYHSTLSIGGSLPRFLFNFERFSSVFNGF